MATVSLPVADLIVPVAVTTVVSPGLHRASVTTTGEVFAPGATLDALIEVSFDGGVTWKHEVSATGMHPTAQSPHLALGVTFGDPEDPYPTHVRATLTPHGAITLGATAAVS